MTNKTNNEIIFSTNSIIPMGDCIPQITEGSEFCRTVIEDGKLGDITRLSIHVKGFTRQTNKYVMLTIFDKNDEIIAYGNIRTFSLFNEDIEGYSFDCSMCNIVELEKGNNIFKYRIGSTDYGMTYLTDFKVNYETINK